MKPDAKGNIKAIVVEDELKIGTYIKHKIEYLDPSVTVAALAENGKQALNLIEEHQPQVVFTDISMPVMDGLELSRIIKNTYPGMIVVIISGYSDFSYAQKAIKYGIFNYILKPLEDEKLLDVLFDIKKNLAYTNAKQERQVLYSDAYMFQYTQGVQYAIFSVCIGNLFYDIEDPVLTEYYREILQEIPWRKLLEEVCGDGQNWYLADEQVVNQKIVGIQVRADGGEETGNLAKRLMSLLELRTSLAIHICLSEQFVPYEDVWNLTKRLRHLMQQKLVIGESQILIAEKEKDDDQGILDIVKMKLSSYIKNYFLHTDLKNFTDEIQIVLRYMIQNRATQENIEKVSLYVLKLLELSSQDCEAAFQEDIQIRQQQCIGMAATEEELMDNLMGCFQKIGRYVEELYEKKIETRVLEYVDSNFLTLEGLEQVADVFGYNYTYLSRLFKKMSGVSLNKYITEKKITLSKQMLHEHPDMVLDEVCELCGYNDCRYFSRVFKAQTGCTPSEYRVMK